VNKLARQILVSMIAMAGMGIAVFGLAIKAQAFSFREDFEFASQKDDAGNFIGFQKNTLGDNGWLTADFSIPFSGVNSFFTSLTFLEPELKLDRLPVSGFTWEETYQESLAPNTGKTWLAFDDQGVAPQTQQLPLGQWEPGTIDAWLVSPLLPLQNGAEVSFFTKAWTPTSAFRAAPDYSPASENLRLQFSTVDVGEYDFRNNVLININPNQVTTEDGGYPTTWTQYKATINGLTQPTQGRFLLNYFVTDAGPGRPNGRLIGIDTFSYDTDPEAIPTPAMLPGLVGLGWKAWRRRRAIA
jgi:hypothetical protein